MREKNYQDDSQEVRQLTSTSIIKAMLIVKATGNLRKIMKKAAKIKI